MHLPEFNYLWQFDTLSPPEAMWTRMADTNRFNRDTGIPAFDGQVIEQRGTDRHLGFRFLGFSIQWDEEPFEWVRPYRYAVVRRYVGTPLKETTIQVELQPLENGGTRTIYKVRVIPRNLLGVIGIPIQVGFLTRRGVQRAVERYDLELRGSARLAPQRQRTTLTPGAAARLLFARESLIAQNLSPALIDRMFEHIESMDDIALARMRPYALADDWHVSRREVLELCLYATRVGVLDLEWDLLCPLCRGASNKTTALREVEKEVHCDACNIDYEVNFERSVELTFHPNPAVRLVQTRVYCLGGPQVTPHIFAQHHLPPHTQAAIALPLEAGRYRVRTLQKRGGQFLFASPDGAPEASLRVDEEDWSGDEPQVNLEPHLILENLTDLDQLLILERWAWSDKAATAADVTARQTFRDLFANEALRPGEQFSVGSLTLVFTDLKRSTELYREIGDAPAFGRVLNHFDVLRAAVIEEEGALVKTMGDAVMAVFRRPIHAVRAMTRAQMTLVHPSDGILPLALKVGIHAGTCIAVNLNNRLDYFGTTVNLAARLPTQSTGADIVVSEAVWKDSEVMRWYETQGEWRGQRIESKLRGYDETFVLWRLERNVEELIRPAAKPIVSAS